MREMAHQISHSSHEENALELRQTIPFFQKHQYVDLAEGEETSVPQKDPTVQR